MAARLIVNADDFGLTAGVNRAVAELYRAGAVTSATLMATGGAFDDAVRVVAEKPELGVGCHVVLTDGVPVLPIRDLGTLAQADGSGFRRGFGDFARDVLLGKVREDDVVREGVAQVRRLQTAGIRVSHLDTHKHTHVLPMVARGLLRVALECGVGAVRRPFEPEWAVKAGGGTMMRRLAVRAMRCASDGGKAEIASPDGAIGVAVTGSLDERALHRLLGAMPSSGTWELIVHPGYDDEALAGVATRLRASREVERRALLRCLPAMVRAAGGPELIHFGDL